jgi:hypothetical protein
MTTEVEISQEQTNSANQWLEWLKTGILQKEKRNYFRFGDYILHKILGYPVNEELNFDDFGVEFSFRNHINDIGVCIEVKGTSQDLFAPQYREKYEHKTPMKQTWDYMGSGNFDYGITTNYRHYILIDRTKGYSKYHYFDFYDIENNSNKLKEFIAIFSRKSIFEGFVKLLFKESQIEELEITKKFYKLYHETRLMIIKEFKSNANISLEEALHYAQLFLNRIIFIFFAEDTGKLKNKIFAERVIGALNPIVLSDYSNFVYNTINNLFESLEKGSYKPFEIRSFNGGLFKEHIPISCGFYDYRDKSFFKEIITEEHKSIINDVQIAGSKAFDWSKSFKAVYDSNEGFDIIIGNPPYIRQELLKDYKKYLEKNYKSYHGSADIYVYFIEQSLKNTHRNGYVGIISSNKWTKSNYGHNLRSLLRERKILQFIDFGDLAVFEDASTYPCILLVKNEVAVYNSIRILKASNLDISDIENNIAKFGFTLNQDSLGNEEWNFEDTMFEEIYSKIRTHGIPFKEFCPEKINFGIKTGLDEVFVIDERKKRNLEQRHASSELIIKPFLIGKQIKRYYYEWDEKYIILTKKGIDIENYPAIYEYLKEFKESLVKRTDIKDKSRWFELRPCSYYEDFLKPKIILAHFGKRPQFAFDSDGFYVNPKSYIIPNDNMYLLGILNSSAIAFYSQSICPYMRGKFYEFGKQYVNKFPIPNPDKDMQEEISQDVIKIIDLHSKRLAIQRRFINRLISEFGLVNISKKLKSFHLIDTFEFLKLIKQFSKSRISLRMIDELEDYFNENKRLILEIKDSINVINKRIDTKVYALFELNDEEINLIENRISQL